jgi:putative sigma-54 modulation protein
LHVRGDGKSASEVAAAEGVPYADEPDVNETPVIVRRKRFQMDAMDEMEAIEQMELLGHESFFVFYNASNHKFNVLYRRRDGTYGLIEPDIA